MSKESASREPADRSIGCQLVDKLESSVGGGPSRKWCRSGCDASRGERQKRGLGAWEQGAMWLGVATAYASRGEGHRAGKGCVRRWSVAEAGEGGHRAWRGDAHRTELREQGCAGHAAGGCQGGAAAPEGRSGLGELCVGRVWCRGTVLRTGGGRWGEGERRGGQRVQRHLVRSLGAALRFCRSLERGFPATGGVALRRSKGVVQIVNRYSMTASRTMREQILQQKTASCRRYRASLTKIRANAVPSLGKFLS